MQVIGHAMITELTSNNSAKMNRQRNSNKPCLQFFAKEKEKQLQPQENISWFTFAFVQPYKDTTNNKFYRK